ncbi:MAG TPA: 3'-5' exonuclease, partial [Terriglobales bacterium]
TSDTKSKDAFIELLGELGKVPGLDDLLQTVRELPPAVFTDEQWKVLESLARLLPVAKEQLKGGFVQEQCCDFAEVALAAQTALVDPAGPTNLALAIGHDIQHLLVDEFQDTSINQVQLLKALMSGWKRGDGRTIFLVGDPMQSIYRFRQAEVGSFLRVWGSREFGSVEVEPLPLTKNFRSRQTVVDWINRTFAEVFSAVEDIAASAVVFERCESAAKDRTEPSVVRTYAQFGKSGEVAQQEAEQIVELVSKLRERGKTVAILVRSKRNLVTIAPRLRAAAEINPSLKFQAVEIETLADRSIVSDLRALTYALLHLGHKVAWLAVLRAPWCGLSLHDLHALCGDRSSEPVWQLLQQRAERLSEDGRQRFERIRPVLAEAIQKRGQLPLRHLVEATWMSLNGPACLREKRDLEDASAYFDLLDELDDGSDLEALGKLEDSVERLFAHPDPDATDAVQVMSIHKAKGLEFDCVILPGLGRATRRRDRELIVWDERSSPDGPELLMAPVPEKTKLRDDRIYKYLQGVESERDENELRRLLYVAATRAKHELHLFGHIRYEPQVFLEEAKEPEKRTFLSLLWPMVQGEFIVQAQEKLHAPMAPLRMAASADPAAQR